MNRIFVTGGSGLLGTTLALALRDKYPVTLGLHHRTVALERVCTSRASLESVDDVQRAFDGMQPSVVVHAAGLADVERCEEDVHLAWHLNVTLAANVAAACAKCRIRLVHISTDHLFAGDEPLVGESHPVAPRNVYARSKAEAERRVLDACPDALIVRTNFYGWGPPYRRSFSDTILASLRRREPISLFDDVFYTPILAEALADAVSDLATLGTRGIVHVAGDERISKYEFGLRVARRFRLDSSLVTPIALGDQPRLAPRPRDMSLSNAYARRLLDRPLGGVEAHLARLHEQEEAGVAGEAGRL